MLIVLAQTAYAWNPRPSWRDSYEVDGICYCDSSNFDHGIGDREIRTPDGYKRSVRQICADISKRYGTGAVDSRVPYNTIACGNAPANDAPDEDLISGCPGRVDLGSAGCFEIGPQWPLAELYGTPLKALDRSLWQISVSDNARASAAMVDGNITTRWTSNKKQTPGLWIQIDLGGQFKINVVDLDSSASQTDFPVSWILETSMDGHDWALSSSGHSEELAGAAITRLKFPQVSARYLRVTQTGQSNRFFWSVHELHIGLVDGVQE